MYDPAILLSVLKEIEEKTQDGAAIWMVEITRPDPAHVLALEYLELGNFLEWSTDGNPNKIVGIAKDGYRLRHDLQRQIQQEQEQRKANKVNRDVRWMTLALLVLAVVSILLSVLFYVCR